MNGYWNGGTLKFNKHWQGGQTAGIASGMYGIRRGDDIVVAPPSYKLHIDLSDYEEVEFDARVRRWIGSQPLYGYGVSDNIYSCRLKGKKWSDVELIPFISLDGSGDAVAGLDGGFADKSLMPYDLGLWQRWHDIFGLNSDTDYIPISSLVGNVSQKPFLYCKADIISVTGRADGGNINEVINSGYYIENLDDNARYVTDGDKVSFIKKTNRYGSPYNLPILPWYSIDEWDNLDNLISGVDIPNVVISGNHYQVTPYEYMTVLPYACAREWNVSTQEKGNRNGDAVIGGLLRVTNGLSPNLAFIKGTASEVFTGDGLYAQMKAPMDFGVRGTFYIKIKEVKSDRVYRISDMVGNI
jgi:hypothetical protein